MKWSKFNILFIATDHSYFLYNSRMNSFFKLNQSLYEEMTSIQSSKKNIEDLPLNELNNLRSKKVIVENNEDENYIIQMLYLKRKKSFKGSSLGIVLAPTLACNFKCPYCYERNLPNEPMNEDIQDKLIKFINLHEKKVEELSLYWHGGEPLIAFQVIKSILDKIQKRSVIPLRNHRMVSNGYLFTHEICDFFKRTKLDYVQITVDGTESTHNQNRVHKSGIPTYKKIISNIDMITNEIPECQVGVRVNIHNGNKNDYPQIYAELSERWKDKNCIVYPALVLGQSNGCDVSCLSAKEKAQFYINLYKKYNFKNINFIPNFKLSTCSAIYENHYVIDPLGLLYKCWADIGIRERSVGNLEDGITNWKYASEYMLNSDKFIDSKCLECNIFPICDGGCNRFRLEKTFNNIPYNVCPVDKERLIQYLEIIYKRQKERRNVETKC